MSSPPRHLEIDLLRTLALAMMVIYHLLFDLQYFYSINILERFGTSGWLFARATATLFLLLVGASFTISWRKTTERHVEKVFKRGGSILASAALVSAATYIMDPETYIRFGILHLIGVSAFILPLLAPLKKWNAVVGIACIALGTMMPPPGFVTLDYFPLLPWIGVILLGAAIGDVLYGKNHGWHGWWTTLSGKNLLEILSMPGRSSLFIYLIHQPILLFLLRLILGRMPSA